MQFSIRFFLIFTIFTLSSVSTASAATLLNVSSQGFANSQSPHIVCTIISGFSGERSALLVFAEADRQLNNQTDPVFYIGRPGDPLTDSNYFFNNDWSRNEAALMIQAAGRTPNISVDAGAFVNVPTGPICIYAYERNASTSLGRINVQALYVGRIQQRLGASDDVQQKSSTAADQSVRALSEDKLLELLSREPTAPDTKMMPNDHSSFSPTPEELRKN